MHTIKLIDNNYSLQQIIKYGLAIIIVIMGGYGYYRFFNNPDSSEPIWMIILLFIALEASILFMTTNKFSSSLQQEKKISYMLWIAIIVMWFISGIGIDQTIWGMLESKYHKVQLEHTSIIANNDKKKFLDLKVHELRMQKEKYAAQLQSLETKKIRALKGYNKKSRQLKDVIWYDGHRCDLSADCTSRKNIAEKALNLSKSDLDAYNSSISALKKEIALINEDLGNKQRAIEVIVEKDVTFEKKNRLILDNKQDEAIVHIWLMNVLNMFLPKKIETPERAYVLLLSFIVYPIYILLVIFVSSNSPERKEARRLAKANTKPSKIQQSVYDYLKKIIIYQIKTRNRKVIVQELEVEKIVEVPVEKEVYKEGKEIVRVEVEVPHLVEKPIIVEKIVEKIVIEKEFVTVPSSIDLNALNKISKTGSVPEPLDNVIQKIYDEQESDREESKND